MNIGLNYVDDESIQSDFASMLLCDDVLAPVNIVTRWFLLSDDAQNKLPDKTLAAEVLAYITPRNPLLKKGAGIIVEPPEIDVEDAASPGPQQTITVECLVLVEPLMNYSNTGTFMSAMAIAQRILTLGHNWSADDLGDFFADRNAIQRARDFEPLRAFRVRFKMLYQPGQPARVDLPVQSIDGSNNVALAAPINAAGADIYYLKIPAGTQPVGSKFPGPCNSHATKYTVPFAASAGDVIRWAAFQSGKLPSRSGYATIS